MAVDKKILFIDDEENILSSLKRIFRRDAIEAHFTTDPDEVFRLVAQKNFSLVISDQRMPKMEGVEVLKKVKEISPRTVRMMLTGYADVEAAMRAVNDGNVFRFLAKPWREQELRDAIQAGISQYEIVEENRRLQALTKHQNKELQQFNEDLEKMVEQRTHEIEVLNADLKRAFFSTIKVLGSLGGILDSSLEGHSRRVAKIAGYIAKDQKLTEKEVFEIQVAAFVMNLGKLVAQRDRAQESDLHLKAVEFSAKVARLIPNIGEAPLYVLHQLENYDGRGRPNQMLGENIPIGSRIIRVAETFDRLLNLGEMELASPLNALELIKAKSGKDFDPKVVVSLESYIENFLKSEVGKFEQNVNLMELQSGMIVSRPVLSSRGEVLICKDVLLNEELLENLWNRHMNEAPVRDVFIYKDSLPRLNRVA